MMPNSDTPQPEPTPVPLPPAVQPRSRFRFFMLLIVAVMALVLCVGYWYYNTIRPPAMPTINQTQPSPQPQRLSVVLSDLAYGPNQMETFTSCVPNGPGPYPGIIVIHGGGWIGGDKSGHDNLCKLLASHGFSVANVDYRLAPNNVWPSQINDVQLAVRYMRAHASQLKMNSKAICSYGNSAGAHLALLLDELTTVLPGDVSTQLASYSPKTQCVVDQFGPTDLPKLYAENPRLAKNIAALFGSRTPSSAPIAYSAASPVDQIGKATGAVLIIQGSSDTTVLPDQSTELKQDLDASHIPEQYVSYTGGHEYQGVNPAILAIIRQQMISFLRHKDQ